MLVVTAAAVVRLGARDGVRLLEPVGRPAEEPAPAAIPH